MNAKVFWGCSECNKEYSSKGEAEDCCNGEAYEEWRCGECGTEWLGKQCCPDSAFTQEVKG